MRIPPSPIVSSYAIRGNLLTITELIHLICTMEFIVSALRELLGDIYIMTHEKCWAQNMAHGSFP